MKIYHIFIMSFCTLLVISCGDSSVSETDNSEENVITTDTLNNTDAEIEEDHSYEEDEATEFLNAININIENDRRSYSGTIGEIPIILEFWSLNKDELVGHCFYPNNGVKLDLVGQYESGSIFLRRMKDGKIREQFNLDGDVEGVGGEWTKENQTKKITLKSQNFSEKQSQYFIDFLKPEIVYNLYDFWMFEPNDFDNLELNNGGLSYDGGDGGTSGRTEVYTDYQALELNPEGDSWYIFVEKIVNESWYSLKEVAAGAGQEDLKEDNTHHVSISLNTLKNGEVSESENYVIEGFWDASVTVANGFVVVQNDEGKSTFVWNPESKNLEKI